MDAPTIELMEGVIGVRPYVPKSEDLENFRIRWNKFLLLQQQPTLIENIRSDVNLFCLQPYDTVWALATAVEKYGGLQSSSSSYNDTTSALSFPITHIYIN